LSPLDAKKMTDDRRRLIVLRANGGLAVTVLYDELECINARLETNIEHTFWSFLGCGRERRIPVVRINAWTLHGGPFSTTIEVEDEQAASELLESIIFQIPNDLQEADDDEEQPTTDDANEGTPSDKQEDKGTQSDKEEEEEESGGEEDEEEDERPEPPSAS
jgi:hypothetical protein